MNKLRLDNVTIVIPCRLDSIVRLGNIIMLVGKPGKALTSILFGGANKAMYSGRTNRILLKIKVTECCRIYSL